MIKEECLPKNERAGCFFNHSQYYLFTLYIIPKFNFNESDFESTKATKAYVQNGVSHYLLLNVLYK